MVGVVLCLFAAGAALNAAEVELNLDHIDVWTLNKHDVKLDKPRDIVINDKTGKPRTFTCITYEVKNGTPETAKKARNFKISLMAVTDAGEVYDDIDDTDVHHKIEELDYKKYKTLGRLGLVKPGKSARGIAIFNRIDAHMDKLKVYVGGINNLYRTETDEQRMLVFSYARPGHQYETGDQLLTVTDVNWEWVWAWYKALSCSLMEKIEIAGPALGTPHALYTYTITVPNRTKRTQKLRIHSVATKTNVPFLGKNRTLYFTDSGTSTVFKQLAIKELGKKNVTVPAKRFFEGDIKPGTSATIRVIFEPCPTYFADELFSTIHENDIRALKTRYYNMLGEIENLELDWEDGKLTKAKIDALAKTYAAIIEKKNLTALAARLNPAYKKTRKDPETSGAAKIARLKALIDAYDKNLGWINKAKEDTKEIYDHRCGHCGYGFSESVLKDFMDKKACPRCITAIKRKTELAKTIKADILKSLDIQITPDAPLTIQDDAGNPVKNFPHVSFRIHATSACRTGHYDETRFPAPQVIPAPREETK